MVFLKGFLQEIENFIWVSSLHWHGFGLNSAIWLYQVPRCNVAFHVAFHG
jgi:hypothetical protein